MAPTTTLIPGSHLIAGYSAMAFGRAGSRSSNLMPLCQRYARESHRFPTVRRRHFLLSERYRLEQFRSLLFDPQQVTAHRDRVKQIFDGRPQDLV
jgi:hypothetical protein